ncbi:MAG: hypothetical protein KME04_06525 [Pleurocapsa minor GSE-CHR-MK-17-07R]|jgi:hypothetical protein|nr:hypothetical protein [Pleurocapsa minor GSE-CHR-MK 17-07R]
MATLKTLVATLEGAGEAYHILPLDSGFQALITRYGSRILGLFPPGEDPENLYWTPTAMNSAAAFASELQAVRAWNIGGERFWIAPEIQYIFTDRAQGTASQRVPEAMDPGFYTMREDEHGVSFSQEIQLRAYNIAEGEAYLRCHHTIRPAANPLRLLSAGAAMLDGVAYAGVTHTFTLAQMEHTQHVAESWNLIQLPPGGQMIIPASDLLETAEYFGSATEESRTVRDGAVRQTITGMRQYKVGYKAASVGNRLAYLRPLGDGQSSLLVRQFSNNPSAEYTEEPPDEVGVNGYSIHVYNDGGQYGIFGELETSGQAIGGATGRTHTEDQYVLWAFVGPDAKLRAIGKHLLGVAI